MAIVALAAVAIVGFPYDGRAALVLGVFVLWSVAVLAVARREPERALHPVVPAVDFALLLALELVAPDTLVGVQSRRAVPDRRPRPLPGRAARRDDRLRIGVGRPSWSASAIRGDAPFDSDLLVFYEAVFFLSALATSVVVGLLRTSESASRLRARELSRRTMQAESEVRRRVAESIHDGPVQELIGLDMILSARAAASTSEATRSAEPDRRGARARRAATCARCATRSSTSAPTRSRR